VLGAGNGGRESCSSRNRGGPSDTESGGRCSREKARIKKAGRPYCGAATKKIRHRGKTRRGVTRSLRGPVRFEGAGLLEGGRLDKCGFVPKGGRGTARKRGGRSSLKSATLKKGKRDQLTERPGARPTGRDREEGTGASMFQKMGPRISLISWRELGGEGGLCLILRKGAFVGGTPF